MGAIRYLVWLGLMSFLVCVPETQAIAAQCPAKQVDAAAKLSKSILACQKRFIRFPGRDPGGARRDACLATVETDFADLLDQAVAAGPDCRLVLQGVEVYPLWRREIDQAIAPLLMAWEQPASGARNVTPASRNRRFSTLIAAISANFGKTLTVEGEFIRAGSSDAIAKTAQRQQLTRKLTRRLRNLISERTDYNGPAADPLAALMDGAVDRIVASVLAESRVPAPKFFTIADGGDGINQTEASQGISVGIGLPDGLASDSQLNLAWGNQPPLVVPLTAEVLAAGKITVAVSPAIISAAGTGIITVTATLSSPAGDIGPPLTGQTSVDTSAPAVAIGGIVNDTGIPGDHLTNDPTLVFVGGAEPGSTVTLTLDNIPLGAVIAETGGQWRFDHTGTTLADGRHTLAVTAKDAAGNANSASLGFVADTLVPTLAIGLVAGDDRLNAVEAGAPLAISGTTGGVEDGQIVTVTLDGTASYTATVAGNAWSVIVAQPQQTVRAGLVEESHTLAANVADRAGNVASQAQRPFTVDITRPTVIISSDKSTLKAGDTAQLTFTFSEIPGGFDATDLGVASGGVSPPAPTTDPKVFTAVYTPTAGTENPAVAVTIAESGYTDPAGNAGAVGTLNLAVDTRPPSPLVSVFVPEAAQGLTQAEAADGTTVEIGLPTPTDAKAGDTLSIAWKNTQAQTQSTVTYTLTAIDLANIANGQTVVISIPAGIIQAQWPAQQLGRIEVAATLTDAAGNASSPASTLIVASDFALTPGVDVAYDFTLAPNPAVVGDTITLAAEFRNVGTQLASNVSGDLHLPIATRLVSWDSGCTPTGTGEYLNCVVGNLDVGTSVSKTIVVKVLSQYQWFWGDVRADNDLVGLNNEASVYTENTLRPEATELSVELMPLLDPQAPDWNFAYRLIVSNLGSSDASGFSVVPSGAPQGQIVWVDSACSGGGTTWSCPFEQPLKAGEAAVRYLTFRSNTSVSNAAMIPAPFNVTSSPADVTVQGTPDPRPDIAARIDLVDNRYCPRPLACFVDPSTVPYTIRDPLTYQVTFQNVGTAPAPPFAGLFEGGYIEHLNSGWTIELYNLAKIDSLDSGCTLKLGASILCDIPALAPGESATRNITLKALAKDLPLRVTAYDTIENRDPVAGDAVLASDYMMSNISLAGIVDGSADVFADLMVLEGSNPSLDPIPVPNQNFTYLLRASNLSIDNNNPGNTATGVIATLPLAGVSFVGADSGCTWDGTQVACPMGDIPPGSMAIKRVVVHAAASGTVTNTLTATAANSASSASTVNVSVTYNPSLGLDIAASAQAVPDTVIIGQDIATTWRYTNIGTVDANEVVARIYLPDAGKIVSLDSGCKMTSYLNNYVECNLGGLAANQTIAKTVVYRPLDSHQWSKSWSDFVVTDSNGNPQDDVNPQNNEATLTFLATPDPSKPDSDLVPTLLGPTMAVPGQNFVYRIIASNFDSAPAEGSRGVKATLNLKGLDDPVGLRFASADSDCVHDTTTETVTCSVKNTDALWPAGSIIWNIVVRAENPGTYHNTVTMSYGGTESDTTNNSSSITLNAAP